MAREQQASRGARGLLGLAALVVVVAGLKASQAILVPFLLAAFLAFLCVPSLLWLERRRVPRWAAIGIILGVVVCVGAVAVTLLTTSLQQFSQNLPGYEQRLSARMADYAAELDRWGIEVPDPSLRGILDPGRAMRFAGALFNALGSMLSNAFLIFLTVTFILIEAPGFAAKLRAGSADPEASLARLAQVSDAVRSYLGVKSGTSLATGLLVTLWLWILGVDFAALWGLLAFLLNFVPTFGSIIAAVPAVLLVLVQLGPGPALVTAGGYLVINVAVSNVIEPRFMARGVGLSMLVVFLSLIFWGWVLGPVGMVVAVPLTVIVRIGLEESEDTRWLAALLGPASAPEPSPDEGDA